MAKSYGNAKINIPVVTGDIYIFGNAVKNAPSYTNLIGKAINMSGGSSANAWMYTNKRYSSSSGNPIDNSGTNITGLIPAKIGDVIDMRFDKTSELVINNIKCFKSDRTEVTTGNVSFNTIINNANVAGKLGGDPGRGSLRFVLRLNGITKDMAYIAFCTTTKDINNVIIAVNESIDDIPL